MNNELRTSYECNECIHIMLTTITTDRRNNKWQFIFGIHHRNWTTAIRSRKLAVRKRQPSNHSRPEQTRIGQETGTERQLFRNGVQSSKKRDIWRQSHTNRALKSRSVRMSVYSGVWIGWLQRSPPVRPVMWPWLQTDDWLFGWLTGWLGRRLKNKVYVNCLVLLCAMRTDRRTNRLRCGGVAWLRTTLRVLTC